MATLAQFANTISIQHFQPAFRISREEDCWDWKSTYTIKKSTRASEQQYSFGTFGAATESTVNETVTYMDFSEQDKTSWTHSTFLAGVMLPKQLIEDAQYVDFMSEAGTALGRSHAYVRSLWAARPFNRAFNSTYTMFDGVELCGTHTNSNGDTIDNDYPSASIDFQSIWDMILYFEYGMVDEAGLPYWDDPDTIMFHPSKLPDVRKALEAVWEPDSGQRNPNTLSKYNLKALPNRMLTASSSIYPWFITGKKFKADMIFWDRVTPSVDQDEAFDSYGIKFRSRSRHSNGAKHYIHIHGCPG
jgi:hypothetical protein